MRYLVRDDGVRLAYQYLRGAAPTMVFLPGFGGQMAGDKASFLMARLGDEKRSVLLLDYSGHGVSGGRFEEGSIGIWRDDALAVIDRLRLKRFVLVGSSMGGWIALLIAQARREQCAGIVGIAAAPDFTERRIWRRLDESQRRDLFRQGHTRAASSYAEGIYVSRRLIEDGRRHLLMHGPIELDCPVRLLQGDRDPEVDWQVASEISGKLTTDDVQVTLIKAGDHSLSRPSDLELLLSTLRPLLEQDRA